MAVKPLIQNGSCATDRPDDLQIMDVVKGEVCTCTFRAWVNLYSGSDHASYGEAVSLLLGHSPDQYAPRLATFRL